MLKELIAGMIDDSGLDDLFVTDANGGTDIHDRSRGKKIWSSNDYEYNPNQSLIDWTQRTVSELFETLSSKSDVHDPNAYNDWYSLVNVGFVIGTGLDLLDVADQPFRDWYDDGMSVDEAVLAVKEAIDFPM